MNRRDFLKALALALSALVLPKARAIKPKPALTGKAATLEMSTDGENWVELPGASLKTQSLTDCVPVTDEWLADVITEEDILKMLDRHGRQQPMYFYPPTLFGHPIVYRKDFPDHTIVAISGHHYAPQMLKNIGPSEDV